MRSMWVIRCLVVALTGALAVALILRGNVLIGGLIGALALARAVLFVKVRRRRDEFRRRIAERRGTRGFGQ